MEVSIRPATEADLPAISAILDYAVGSKMVRGDLAWGDKAYDESSLTGAIARGVLFVAESGASGVVATFRLDPEDLTNWGAQPPVAVYVQRFATASGNRGQKLGSQIMDLVGERVRGEGKHFIRLTCLAKNSKLCAYHEANGFTRADFKAKPLSFGAPLAYYEKLVDPDFQEPQIAAKRSLLQRFRRRA